MYAKIYFLPVGNGDMTLVVLESGQKILIDVNIRAAADNPADKTPDVARHLRKLLARDDKGRLYVDAFLLSHPDEDHCRGLEKHFHLGVADGWSKQSDKIFIREVWSSPMVFRRASRHHTLCPDAKAFNKEARRRVRRFRDTGGRVTDGDRILILGEDEKGKTDGLEPVLVKVGERFTKVNGVTVRSMGALLLAPLPKSETEDDEEMLSKNSSSTILRISLSGDGKADACHFLTGGDAGVSVWEHLWEKYSRCRSALTYHILQAPHHCSWRSLSHDSWSELGEDAQVSEGARNALSQARRGAVIVASSKAIKDDGNDPPCIGAKREYESIVRGVQGKFKCVGEPESHPEVVEVEIGRSGPRFKTPRPKGGRYGRSGAVGSVPLAHG